MAEGLGYRLVVEPGRPGCSRPASDATRPGRCASGRAARAGRSNRARYACSACAGRAQPLPGQLLLDELVAQVRSAVADAGLAIDLDGVTDRRALPRRWACCCELGVLVERDGDSTRWAEDGSAQSLLDVRRDRLRAARHGRAVAAQGPQDLLDAAALPSAAGGARVAVRRGLLENPVLSVEDLTEEQASGGASRNREPSGSVTTSGSSSSCGPRAPWPIDPDDDPDRRRLPRHRLGAARCPAGAGTVGGRGPRRAPGLSGATWWPVARGAPRQRGRRRRRRHGRGLRKATRDVALLARPTSSQVLADERPAPAHARLDVHAAAARYAPRRPRTPTALF